MQNAPTMLGQKMMNRQAPYGPIGMVSQDMSGNKKKTVVAIPKLFFNTTNITTGLTLSNNNATVTNTTAAVNTSAKSASLIPIGATFVYFEFVVRTNDPGDQQFGLALGTFNANHIDNFSLCVGSSGIGNTFAYRTDNSLLVKGINQGAFGTPSITGDVIGFQIEMTASTFFITIRKNGTIIANRLNYSATFTQGNTVAWVPAWSSNLASTPSGSISNQIYSYPGYTPVGAF